MAIPQRQGEHRPVAAAELRDRLETARSSKDRHRRERQDRRLRMRIKSRPEA